MKTCSCCESAPVHPLCGDHCEKCHRPFCCSQCDGDLDTDQIESWSPGESTDMVCESCEKNAVRHLWMDETCAAIQQLAEEHEWEVDPISIAQTGSRYFRLFRECSSCLGVVDRECECETLTVRVSDHATAHCREDISIAMNPSGDDHTMNDLELRLKREVTHG